MWIRPLGSRASIAATLSLFLLDPAPLAAQERQEGPPPEHLDEWMPDDVVGYLTVRDLAAHTGAFLASPLRRRLEDSLPGRLLKSHPGYGKLLAELRWFKAASEREPLDLLRDLFGQEVVAGLRVTFSGPEAIVLTRTAGPKRVAAAREALEKAILDRQGALPILERKEYSGHTLEGGRDFAFTTLGSVLAFSNGPGALEKVIDLAAGRSVASVKKAGHFARAAAWVGNGGAVTLVLRPQFIPQLEIPERLENFAASQLAGGWAGALAASDLLAAVLRVRPGGLELALHTRFLPPGLEEKYACFFPDRERESLRDRLGKRPVLGVLEIHRDLARWWNHRGELLAPAGAAQLEGVARVLSAAFGGSFEEEILPELGPRILLVAARQTYEGLDVRPVPAIPGFAAVLELDRSGDLQRRLAAAFHTVVGLVNAGRAGRGKDVAMLRVESEKTEGTELHSVDLRAASNSAQGRPGLEASFSPSLAVVGRRVVLSSSRELARLVVAELSPAAPGTAPATAGEGPPAASAKARDSLVLKPGAIRAVLEDNREALAASSRREEGTSREEAEGKVEALLELLGFLREVRLEIWLEGGGLRARLEIDGPEWAPAGSR